MKFLRTILMLLVLPSYCLAQNSNDKETRLVEDSLKTAFLNAKADTTKRNLLDALIMFYIQDNTQSRDEAYLTLESMVEKKGDSKLKYMLLIARVSLIHTPDSIIETRKFINEFLDHCRRLDDGKRYFQGLVALSMYESASGNYNESLNLLLHSLDYARDTLKDQGLVSVAYMSIGVVYNEQLDTLKAIEYNKKALETSINANDHDIIAAASNNLGMIYKNLGQYDSAKVYYRKSINMFQQFDKSGMLPNPLGNMAEVFRLTQEYDSALVYAHQSIHLAKELNYDYSLSGGYWTLAQTFRDMGKSDSAGIYYSQAKEIIEKTNSKSDIRIFYSDLSAFYASVGNYQSAYEYLQKAEVIKDLIYNTDNNKVLKEIEAKYQASKKEQEILKREEQINRQRMFTYSAMATSVFFLLLLFFIYRSNRLKQKSNKLLAIAKDKAEQSEKFKQQFLANMSHEIRTPMNAVMGMTNLLIDKGPRDDQLNYLEGIQKSSNTLLHIINDILDISKIEAGKIAMEEIDYSIHEVVDQVVQTLHYKAVEKGLELITDIDPDLPDVVLGDPTRLNQVLMNLAGNAVKFTEKGSVTIEIKKTGIENKIRYSIIDTGIGISKDNLQSVFESFSQAHSSDTRKFGGTGLGLTISKQLVELMGGNLSIESEEGAGTVFSFELNCPVGSMEQLITQKSAEQIEGSILNGLKILVVDDNEYNRIVVHDTLMSKAQVEIMLAINGKESVELASQNNFDVILMDVQMPIMNGYDATQHIRNNFDAPKNQVPIIALTASVVRSDLDKCRAAGMNDYVPKPFKTSQLISSIAKVTGREIKFAEKKNNLVKFETRSGSSTITNLSYLHKFCEGDKKRMQKYVNMFILSAPALVEKLNTALTNQDFEEIASQVHGYKTNWLMMGMIESRDLAFKIEQLCRKDSSGQAPGKDIARLITQIQAAVGELTQS